MRTSAPCPGDGDVGEGFDLSRAVFGFAIAYVWFKVSDSITPLRVPAETELEGLDLPEMGTLAYPDYSLHPATGHTPPLRFMLPFRAGSALCGAPRRGAP
jgi:hypothetical protein